MNLERVAGLLRGMARNKPQETAAIYVRAAELLEDMLDTIQCEMSDEAKSEMSREAWQVVWWLILQEV